MVSTPPDPIARLIAKAGIALPGAERNVAITQDVIKALDALQAALRVSQSSLLPDRISFGELQGDEAAWKLPDLLDGWRRVYWGQQQLAQDRLQAIKATLRSVSMGEIPLEQASLRLSNWGVGVDDSTGQPKSVSTSSD